MWLLIEHGDVHAPAPLGRADVLIAGERIVAIGADPARAEALAATSLPVETIDASGCIVVPGFVDPHAHLIGAGGEQGVASRLPEVPLGEIVRAGVTTVVGCLGTDAIGRSLEALLLRARQLHTSCLTAYIHTGSFQTPPPTLTGSVMRDLVLIPEVIGVGEVAIADWRSSQPSLDELARIVADAAVGGSLAGKAGVTHFHVGPATQRLRVLHELLDRHEIRPRHVYPTHVNRTPELLDDAAALARRGCWVDTDVIDRGLCRWLPRYWEAGGPPERFTVSSDAHTPGGDSRLLPLELEECVMKEKLPLERVLSCFTSNPADALGLSWKGRLRPGADGDVAVLDGESLAVRDVVSRGRIVVRNGRVVAP
jgi:beta-aspartyl-dipeptidase (metallo-type)